MGGSCKARKEFVDRRNSATYRLFPRAGAADASDRVFVRIDQNPYSVAGFLDDEEFSTGEDLSGDHLASGGGTIPDHVRREILELGLPDDGYNYLLHLRELRPSASSSGGGASAAFVPNHRARLDLLPLDVKAYDATRVRIGSDKVSDELDEGGAICKVAAKTAAVRRVEKAVDPDVARLLEESDVSRSGSDDEDLEEDFVVMANRAEGGEEEEEEEGNGVFADAKEDDEEEDVGKERVRRLLDEQFDLLALEEYGDSGDDDDGDGGVRDAEHELPPEVIDELKLFHSENLEVDEEYRAPADFVRGKQEPSTTEQVDESADVIRKCAEYAEKYLNESGEDEHVVLVPESSDESEVWDCETIVSTYSNLDNHPGKIQAPGTAKRWLPKVFPGETAVKKGIIKLEGKEKLPVEYLPQKKRNVEKEKKAKPTVTSSDENLKKVIYKKESKDEKKERKAAVKEERREARRAKKELKGLYKSETQKAQKVAAVTGPSSIRLM